MLTLGATAVHLKGLSPPTGQADSATHLRPQGKETLAYWGKAQDGATGAGFGVSLMVSCGARADQEAELGSNREAELGFEGLNSRVEVKSAAEVTVGI